MTITAYIFTGQGFDISQVYDYSKSTYYDEIAEYFYQIFKVSLPSYNKLEINDICRNEISAAILCLSSLEKIDYARQILPSPSFIAGYSVGQYLALYYAGCLNRENLISIIFKRCKIMNIAAFKQNASLVATAGLPLSTILKLIKKHGLSNKAFLSNDNAVGNYTFAVERSKINDFISICSNNGAYRVKCLNTTGGWHSKYMATAKPELFKLLDDTSFKESQIKIIDNTYVNDNKLKPENAQLTLCEHLVQPVKWRETMKYFLDNDVNEVFEISNFDLLTRMGIMSSREMQFHSLGLQ